MKPSDIFVSNIKLSTIKQLSTTLHHHRHLPHFSFSHLPAFSLFRSSFFRQSAGIFSTIFFLFEYESFI